MNSGAILFGIALGSFWLWMLYKKLGKAKRSYDGTSSMLLRLQSVLGVVIGAVLMCLTQYLIRTQSTFLLRIAGIGPVMLMVSVTGLIVGKSKLGQLLYIPVLCLGVVVGVLYISALKSGEPNRASEAIASVFDPVLDRLGLTTPKVTRAQLDTAIANATARSQELNKRKQTANPGDKAAMDVLNRDIEAYNKRTAEVKVLYDAFMKQSKELGDFRKKIAGVWQMQDSLDGGLHRIVITHYNEDGSLLLEGTLSNGATGTVDGHWEIGNGNKLVIYYNPSTNPNVMTTDKEQRYSVERVDENELVIRSADGERTVKKRVN